MTKVIVDAQIGAIQRIEVRGDRLSVELKNGSTYKSRKEYGSSIVTALQDSGVTPLPNIEVKAGSFGGPLGLIFTFLPLLLFISLIVAVIVLAVRRR